jgi:NAD(P)-dependent dehydrogenase (short-subunit alcohol dehydrogenase family)
LKVVTPCKIIEQQGQHAVPVVCDLSELASVRRAAAQIVALRLPIAGLLNNAGIMQMRATKNTLGWDMTFATNHLGPFALTEALMPHLPDGANVVFVASAVEDPERQPAKAVGFRGARYISAEASAREWIPDGSKMPGMPSWIGYPGNSRIDPGPGMPRDLAIARQLLYH